MSQARGVVRWTNAGPGRKKTDHSPGFGLAFTGVTVDSLSLLRRYLARLGV